MSAVTKSRLAFALPAAIVALLAAGGETWRLALRYQRAGLPLEEPWRWLSGHLVHLGPGHAVLNLVGLALVGTLFAAQLSWRGWLAVYAAAALAIDAGLWLAAPGLDWYVGLSGVLHGLFAAGALSEALGGRRGAILLLLALAAKLAWEQSIGPLPMTASAAGGPVVVDAHLYGALGGLLACALIRVTGGATPRSPPA